MFGSCSTTLEQCRAARHLASRREVRDLRRGALDPPLTDEARGEIVLDARAGRQAGAYLARHARSHGLGIADALIAAAASTAQLRLWTLNQRHYPMKDVHLYEP